LITTNPFEDAVQANQQRCSAKISTLVWNPRLRTLSIGKTTVTFTPTEYRLIFPLGNGQPATYAALARQTYNCTLDDQVRVLIDKHIDRIRGKLRSTGIYVYCVLNYGYVLLEEEP
jgi:DNA-binding response OmpR family regulator